MPDEKAFFTEVHFWVCSCGSRNSSVDFYVDHKGYVHYIESARFLAGEFVGYAVAKLPFGPCVTALVCPVMFFYGGNKRHSATAELLHNVSAGTRRMHLSFSSRCLSTSRKLVI